LRADAAQEKWLLTACLDANDGREMMRDMIRRRVLVSGLVQGVAFRAYTRETARRIGVNGWVRNLPDGRVEALVEGDSELVHRMLSWLKKGPPSSRVDDVQVIEESPTGEFSSFDVAFTRGSYW
jgi:acylphosphatase